MELITLRIKIRIGQKHLPYDGFCFVRHTATALSREFFDLEKKVWINILNEKIFHLLTP